MDQMSISESPDRGSTQDTAQPEASFQRYSGSVAGTTAYI